MKASFTIAAIVGLAEASTHNRPTQSATAEQERFTRYQAQYGKAYRTQQEYNWRNARFNESAAIVDAQNAASQGKGPKALHLKLNQFADMTDEEFQGWLGLDASIGENVPEVPLPPKRRGLQERPTEVDHVAAGNMLAVKTQGGCGSCWAFTANSTLEGAMLASGKSVERLSEQQLVDCTSNNDYNTSLFGKDYGQSGCNGGWMTGAWSFHKEQGIMLDADYPYIKKVQQCQHDTSMIIGTGSPTTWGYLGGSTALERVDEMKAEVAKKPLSVALAVGGAFRLYDSGVLTKEDGCGDTINHGVVLVGYKEAEYEEPGEAVTTCTVEKFWRTCETVEPVPVIKEVGYWRLQNSWGADWGDNGFINIAIDEEDLKGICKMQYYVMNVEV